MTCFKKAIPAFLIAVLLVSAVNAGVYIESKSSGSKHHNGTTVISLGENAIRVEDSRGGEGMLLIFRADKDLAWVINKNSKSYYEITRADLQKVAQMRGSMGTVIEQQMNMMTDEQKQQMKKAMEQIKNLPPEQQEMIKKNMPGFMDGNPAAAPAAMKKTYKKEKSGVKVNGFNTTQYSGLMGKEKVEEIFTASISALGLRPSDVSIMQRLGEFIGAMGLQDDKTYGFKIGTAEQVKELGYEGMPVKTVRYQNGKAQDTEEVVTLEKRDFPDALFALDSGLKKEQSPLDQMKMKMSN